MRRLLPALLLLLAAWPARAQPSDATRQFLDQAAAGGLFEVAAATLAEARGSATLQPLARRLLADHETINRRLAELGQAMGAALPDKPDAAQLKRLDDLEAVSAAAFDRRFLDSQRIAHESAVRLFADYAETGDDPVLRAYAAEVLPTLRAHLADVETLSARTP